jgi:ABC-2 type transport system ATP-binding protein
MSTLQMTNLTRRFGTMTAVDDLTLRVEAGEVFGLLGPNGAGKSTAIKMLTTLLAPTAGSAQVAGYDIQRQASEVRRVIGYVPQALSADGTLTGYENLLGLLTWSPSLRLGNDRFGVDLAGGVVGRIGIGRDGHGPEHA